MKQPAIVVLSKHPDLFAASKAALDEWAPTVPKILVRDGDWIDIPVDGWQTVAGARPFGFSANANLGFQAAGDRDVVLMNDDAYPMHRFLEPLREAAYADRNGIVSPQVIGAARLCQRRPSQRIEQARMVAFVAVYLRRDMINELGPMDERFSCSYEDDDYCLRAKLAGWNVVV